MKSLALVALGGAVGAVARWAVGLAVFAAMGRAWPWGTLLVNAVGSLALGALYGWSERAAIGPEARLLLGTGFCGALTTFSTFSVETLELLGTGQRAAAAANVLVNVAVGLGLAALGLAITRA